jgi:hypothetical protein
LPRKARQLIFCFYDLSKPFFAIAFRKNIWVIPKHKEEATDDIREKGERG